MQICCVIVCVGRREVWEDKINQAGLMRNVINGRDENFSRKKQNMSS